MTAANPIYSTRPVPADVQAVLDRLSPGQRIRVTQTVRIGSTKTWQLVVEGVFRHVDSLATGLATDRRPGDDIVVPVIHFTKDNKEMTTIAVDARTKIEILV